MSPDFRDFFYAIYPNDVLQRFFELLTEKKRLVEKK
jgi:hypothetical protein